MGMAASQARYLGLTARKTNVEYEGQQVNQARVALANQSAGLFNQLLSLEVPQPPSTADFTKVQYSYQDGINGETISSMTQLINDPDGYNYNVTHFHYADIYRGQKNLLSNPQVATKMVGGVEIPTYVGNHELATYVRGADKDLDTAFDQICADWPEDFTNKLGYNTTVTDIWYDANGNDVTGDYSRAVTRVVRTPDGAGEVKIDNYIPDGSGDWTLKSTATEKDTPNNVYWHTTLDGKTMFALRDDLLASAHSATDPTKPIENQQVKLPEFFAQDNKEKVERTQRALVDIDGSGRAETIRYEDSSVVYTLNTETITDDAAYKDAMNQYNYNREQYDKQIQDINAKTEQIQAEDRTLELRLRQLDTEQDALQTEMEAVKKVIEKNIESTFKTFE